MHCSIRIQVALLLSSSPLLLFFIASVTAAEPPALTTLSDQEGESYRAADKPYVVLQRGDVRAVVVNNEAVDDDVLPGHRAGYSGVASLTHTRRGENLFVPAYAGLNFEHIHDGTVQSRDVLFEPRHAPMELRVIDEHCVELYQAPTPHYGLESCLRYQILPDGCLEMTLECIPRRPSFRHGYVGLFWASYIHQPQSLDLHFLGRGDGETDGIRWIRGVTPRHGALSTHLSVDDDRRFPHDDEFPLTLVFNRSRHRYVEPWYYGVSHEMALALMFRSSDQIRFSQSPSGGGRGNPAWDFQHLIPDYKTGRCYQIVMRALYVPFESPDQMRQATASHRQALNP